MRRNFKRENRETPETSQRTFHDLWERSENATGGNADMNVAGESDESVVPTKQTNNDAAEALAESVGERDSTKRNAKQATLHRTQNREKRKSCGLHGVREAARRTASSSSLHCYTMSTKIV
jgi:hypothetical protein